MSPIKYDGNQLGSIFGDDESRPSPTNTADDDDEANTLMKWLNYNNGANTSIPPFPPDATTKADTTSESLEKSPRSTVTRTHTAPKQDETDEYGLPLTSSTALPPSRQPSASK
ncbi:hypothetical protein DL89DRAFT_269338 [Linderina pennispora]|uniref:Uncharacterized protein n=1 Tax=Linderina pennispora TaxID=61395 RepID=A0A1Y1W215_9FUNG|nr:uncharacterized protein DL89DRAFT_269338 [Linderina pennispora]ORX67538.1 hypothetical protein DL89DRAFT_269338 [Linderina pennispora]